VSLAPLRRDTDPGAALPDDAAPPRALLAWFERRGSEPAEFQLEAWRCLRAGIDALVHAPTGSGKSLAGLFGAVWRGLEAAPGAAGLRLLWLTPVRALAQDLAKNLGQALAEVLPAWRVEARTGDTPSGRKQRQLERPPEVLVTTPESLALLLTRPGFAGELAGLEAVVVDEWHELLGSKRGVLAELGLARLRQSFPGLVTLGLSATLGNLEQAAQALVGPRRRARLIAPRTQKAIEIETLLPQDEQRLPWGGHMGLPLLPDLLTRLDPLPAGQSALLFTNTRAQAERWYQALLGARPDWAGALGLHHGSLDADLRRFVESELAAGRLKACVATSSLDLGVDFSAVSLVVQIGSPKGVARLSQRAGRSGHAPGRASRVLCVPTQALEVLEFSAARAALAAGRLESKAPLGGQRQRPLDVLCQHVVSLACAGPLAPAELLDELRGTHAFAELSEAEWRFVLDFVRFGGETLRAYERFARLVELPDGRLAIRSQSLARRHRLAIGTIVSDQAVALRFQNGRRLGTIEEGFVARLKPGDRFRFAGQHVELLRLQGLEATVRLVPGASGDGDPPRWMGGRMPLSSELADGLRAELAKHLAGRPDSPELEFMSETLAEQQRLSRVPAPDELLIELSQTHEGQHLFVYPFAGRSCHEGLAALMAFRLTRRAPCSVAAYVNDIGLHLLTREPLDLSGELLGELLSPRDLLADLLGCLNGSELARRRFREVARVAGLVFQGFPGERRAAKDLQLSSGLLFDTLSRYEPDHLLLAQARREVLEEQLEFERLSATLERLAGQRWCLQETAMLSPFGFALWAEAIRERLSSESFEQRLAAMAAELERARGRRPMGRHRPPHPASADARSASRPRRNPRGTPA
jgi:ATP-dependent Lhr-like helicase